MWKARARYLNTLGVQLPESCCVNPLPTILHQSSNSEGENKIEVKHHTSLEITLPRSSGFRRTKLVTESADETVEGLYLRGAQCVRSINLPISSLNSSPKCLINSLTMCGGVQSGRVHDVMVP